MGANWFQLFLTLRPVVLQKLQKLVPFHVKEPLVMRPKQQVLKLPDNVGVGEVGVWLPDLQTAALQPLQGEVAVRPDDGDNQW